MIFSWGFFYGLIYTGLQFFESLKKFTRVQMEEFT